MSLLAYIFIWLSVAVLIICPAFIFTAMYFIRLNIFLKAQCRIKTKEKIVLLTFDDGPDPVQTPKVLDVLRKHNAKAMFFLIGKNIEAYPEIVKQIVQDGHFVGNHTYSHQGKFPIFSANKMAEELVKTDGILQKITGTSVTFFRPPFGITNIRISRIVRKLNYKVIGWNIRSYDTSLPQQHI
jgi:peptidoglycan/xylan/chitin deacetylase (PgdA/CDA1 family)